MNNQLSILFAGDVVCQKVDFNKIVSDRLYREIKNHDISVCNFEAPILSKDAIPIPIPKAGPNVFQNTKAAVSVANSGFNLVSIANNHIYDYGQASLEKTIYSLKMAGVQHIGAGSNFEEAYKGKIWKQNNIKLGLFAFCESEFGALTSLELKRGGYAWINHLSVNQRIQLLRNEVDILLIQVHAGVEQVELPLPEWRRRYQEIIDIGADAVIAHHPHVPQGWEEYKGKPIFYSLGNFYFDLKNKHPLWNKGYCVSLKFTENKLREYKILPIIKKGTFTDLLEDMEYWKYLVYLCDLLRGDDYIKLVNNQAVKLWEERYKNYYYGFNEKSFWKNTLKQLAKKILGRSIRSNKDLLMILHNIRIESHKWSVERAISLLVENE